MSPSNSSPCEWDLGWSCAQGVPSDCACKAAETTIGTVEVEVNNYLGITVAEVEELLASITESLSLFLSRTLAAIEDVVDQVLSTVHDTHIATGCPCTTQVFVVLLPWQQQSLTALGRCPPGYHLAGASAGPADGTPPPTPPGSGSSGAGSVPPFPAGVTDTQVVQLLQDLLRRLLAGAGGASGAAPMDRGALPGFPAVPSGSVASGEVSPDQVPVVVPPGCVPDVPPDFGSGSGAAGLGETTEVSSARPLSIIELAGQLPDLDPSQAREIPPAQPPVETAALPAPPSLPDLPAVPPPPWIV